MSLIGESQVIDGGGGDQKSNFFRHAVVTGNGFRQKTFKKLLKPY